MLPEQEVVMPQEEQQPVDAGMPTAPPEPVVEALPEAPAVEGQGIPELRQSIAAFSSDYSKTQDPRRLLDIASAYYEMGDAESARNIYERFLKEEKTGRYAKNAPWDRVVAEMERSKQESMQEGAEPLDDPSAEPAPPSEEILEGGDDIESLRKRFKGMNRFENDARAAAKKHGVPEGLFLGIIGAESSWNPAAIGPKLKDGQRAFGLTQIIPSTAKELGINLRDPKQQLDGGAKHVRQMYDATGSWNWAAAAYNMGIGQAKRFMQKNPNPPAFSQKYLDKVKRRSPAGEAAPEQMTVVDARETQPFPQEFGAPPPGTQRAQIPIGAQPDVAAQAPAAEPSAAGLDPYEQPLPGASVSYKQPDVNIRQAQQKATRAAMDIAKNIGTWEALSASQKSGLMKNYNEASKNEAALWADRRDATLRQIDEGLADERRMIDEQVKREVDPNRYWSNLGTGQKVANIIAVAIGGFTQGFTGGRIQNTALQMINQQIERDIAAQKANILSGDRAIRAKRGLLANLYQKYGVMEKAEAHARALNRQGVIDEMNRVALATKSPTAILNSRMMANKLYADQLAREQKDATKSVQMGYGGVDLFRRKMEIFKALKKEPKNISLAAVMEDTSRVREHLLSDDPALLKQAIDNMRQRGGEHDKVNFRAVNKAMANVGTASKAFKDYLIDIVRIPTATGLGGEILSPVWKTEAGQLIVSKNEMEAAMVKAVHGARASEWEGKRMKGIVPIFRQTTAARIQAVNSLQKKRIAEYEAYIDAAIAAGDIKTALSIMPHLKEVKKETPELLRIAGSRPGTDWRKKAK